MNWMTRQRMRMLWLPALTFSLALAVPLSLNAQTGQITGQVVDAATQRSLGEVQVFIDGSGLGALTRADGRYLILNVPVGVHTVTAQRIGMETQTQQVTVAAGASISVDFSLSTQALGLDEIVVTGTAGQARRREVGTAVAQVNLADAPEPITSVDQALAARAPGVISMRSSGMAGSGSQIRLRGNVSIAMSNQPLVYIDGVRTRSDGYALNHAVGQHVAFGPKDVMGPMNDINPNDIERIEIVKGPAATALYGTEAAGGVIQIFTKRGSAGAATWQMQVDQGSIWVNEFGPDNAPYMRLNPWLRGTRDETFDGSGEFTGNFLTPVLNGGHQSRYSLSVRGGGNSMNYYLSGSIDDNQGLFETEGEEKYLLRGNVGFQPASNVDLQWTTSITQQNIDNAPSGSSPYSISHNGYKRAPGDYNGDGQDDNRHATYVGSNNVDVISRLLDYQIKSQVQRVVSGLTVNYAPMPRFTNRLTLGMDRIDSDMRNIRPFGYVNDPRGSVSDISWSAEQLTADYVGSFNQPIMDDLRASFSWGGQWVVSKESQLGASGRTLPGPGEHTVSSGASYTARETRQRVVTGGFFGQTLFDYQDKYFLTVALRIDGNSAFGEDFGLQPYPRATLSWVTSDEEFWPEDLGELKIRAAWGHAGRAPGAFDAVRTWQPVPWLGQTAFDPLVVGNADLGPERTVEWETGFDGSFVDERLRLGFTYYNQETRDALVPVQLVPSTGFTSTGGFGGSAGSQLRNVGILSNKGIEIDASGTVIQNQTLSWDVGLNIYTNKSEAVDLGGVAGFGVSGGGWIAVGQPVPAVRYDAVRNPGAMADPDVARDSIYGPNMPTHTFTPSMALRFGNGIIVSARGEYQGGHYIFDRQSSSSAQRGQVSPLCDASVLGGIRGAGYGNYDSFDRYLCSGNYSAELVYPNDFFRMRDLTFSAPVPFNVPGATSAQFTASLQNFWTWTTSDFLAMDPEMAGNQGMQSGLTRAIWEHPPPPASFRASVRVMF